jgi:hypothetical protein
MLPNSMIVSVGTNETLQIMVIHDWEGFAVPGNYLVTVSAFFNFFIITNLIHKFLVHSHKLVIIKKLYYDARPTKYQVSACFD